MPWFAIPVLHANALISLRFVPGLPIGNAYHLFG
jgi:hypothetical protein